MTNNQSFLCTLEHYEDIAPNIRHFVFSASQAVEFLPGQFITLYWMSEDHKKIHRNYSLANYGGYNTAHPERLELAASYVKQGFASERLFAMQVGEQLEGSGPFGKLILREETVNRYLLIATGTGITPYRTMLPLLAERMRMNTELRILLLFGARYESDLLYRDDILSFAAENPHFSVQFCCSRTPNPKISCSQSGYVTQVLDKQFLINPAEDIAYLCGNPNMIDDVRQILSEKGLPASRIRQERYTSPKKRTFQG